METGTPEEVPVVQESREEDLELLPELVTHLRDRRTELREQWANRITNAHLLSAMTDEEIFSMATSVYDTLCGGAGDRQRRGPPGLRPRPVGADHPPRRGDL